VNLLSVVFSEHYRSQYGSIPEDVLIAKFLADAGQDRVLSSEQVHDLLHGRFVGEWREVFFQSDEMLAGYLAMRELTTADYCTIVIALLCAAQALSHGAGALDFIFDKALTLMRRFGSSIDSGVRAEHLEAMLTIVRKSRQ
jgi:hypothetical protein